MKKINRKSLRMVDQVLKHDLKEQKKIVDQQQLENGINNICDMKGFFLNKEAQRDKFKDECIVFQQHMKVLNVKPLKKGEN